MSFNNRGPNTGNGKRRTVEGMGNLVALRPFDLVANVGATSLVISEPRHRRNFEPLIDTGCVDLDVEGAGRGVTDVAGAKVEHSIGEPECTNKSFGASKKFFVQGGSLFWSRVRKDLDLVELVHA